MRKILLLLVFALMSLFAKAQLADGSTAPNWTLTDINGNSHTLYDVLNSGKAAVLDFSATWCGPCWNYHNQGVLEDLWEAYGPGGSDQIMVYFIEADVNTNLACLYGPTGCVGGTTGNWVQGTGYPIINLTSSAVSSAYAIGYYPTLYAVSPDKKVYEVGQASKSTWESWLFQSFNMEVNGTSSNATCPNTGEVDLTVTSGYLNKTYQWSNGSNTEDLNGVNAGVYSVTVSDSHGFSRTASFNVAGPAVPLNVNNAVTNNATCFNADNGAIDLNTSGGYPGYSYLWSNGLTSANIQDLGPGTYSVVITDNQGCDLGETFTIEEPEDLTSSAFANNATCGQANGNVTIESNGGTGFHYYQLGSGTATTSNSFFDLAANNYEYTVTDNNGCTTQGTFEILSTGAPTSQAAATGQLSCSATTVTVSGTGSATGAGITYLWSTANGNIVSGANTINAVVSAVGTYTLVVTNTSLGCSSQSSTTVTSINNAPSANAGAPQTITCAIPQVTLNGTGSTGPEFTYNWTTSNGNIVSGANTNTPVVNAAGTYNLAVTNTTTNCVTSSTVTVSADVLPPAMTATPTAQLTCAVTSVELCATAAPNSTVSWNINGTTVNSLCATVNAAGSYTATAVGTNGCSTTATSVVSAAAGLPQVSAQTPANLTCLVQEVTITGELVGNVAEHTITWTTANGNIVSGGNTLTPVVNKAGTYSMLAVNNTTNCQSTLNVTVNEINNTPVAQYSTANANGQLSLNSSATVPGTVTWNLGNGQTASGNSVNVSFPTSGTYTICMTLENECGTNTNCSDVVYFTAFAVSGQVENPKCADQTGSVTTNVTGGPITGAVAYSWTGPNGFTSTSASISGVPAGVYTCVISDAAGLTATSTFTITSPAAIEATANITGATNGQSNGAINLVTIGGTGALNITWSNGATGASISNLPAGSYSATAIDANGCQKTFGPFVVETISSVNDPAFVSELSVYPNPTSNFVMLDLKTTEAIQAVVSIINNIGQVVYSSRISGSTFNEKIDVTQLQSGVYTIQVKNDKGSANRKFIVVR